MKPSNGNEEGSVENTTPTHDSGYSNTCNSNSQSNTSSGSSISRDSNSSGYHGGNPSTFGSCTKSLPHPISKRKDKDKSHKEKKSKGALLTGFAESSQNLTAVTSLTDPLVIKPLSNHPAEFCQPIFEKKTDEVAVVELVDATDPAAHNDSSAATGAEAGLASKASPNDECSSQSTEEYYAVVSMHDGLVLHATPSLHASLGYPKDSWTGKLFTDFLDPRDKCVLTQKIASEIAGSKDFCSSGANARKESVFCRLRRSHDDPCERGGPSQSAECVQYVPYRVNLLLQNFHGDKHSKSRDQITLLIISFQAVRSAYKEPEETIIPTTFTTRHTSTCHLSYVDPDVVQYLGYLPQDMIDRSLFDFYYPEDLPLIKDIYETVINLKSSSFRSRPYRFIVKNGGLVVLETEWSTFVNPWTKNLEFVVGHHRVLKGPADPNIFSPPSDKNDLMANISEEVLKEAKVIQKEIMALLAEGVQRKPYDPVAECDLLPKKELTSFVESILQEINNPAQNKDHMAVDDRSFSEHDSVMLGEISPHHEYYDSKSSTETPPSYNQLNYHDNIERFFNSNLGTAANNGLYTSDEENLLSCANSSDEPGKNNNSKPELKYSSSTNGSDNSGSAGNLSSESNNQQSISFDSLGETSNMTSTNSMVNSQPKPTMLTESLLNKHNEDMEKLMVQKHREQKKGDKRNKASLNDQAKAEQPSARGEPGNPKSDGRLKRSGSQTREGDCNFKMPKYDDSAKLPQNMNQMPVSTNSQFAPSNVDTATKVVLKTIPTVNPSVWPTASMTIPSATTITQQCFTTNAYSQAVTRFPSYPQMLPVYYLPVLQPRETPPLSTLPREHPGPPNVLNQPAPYCFMPVPYMTTALPSIMYPPLMGASAPAAMMYRSLIMPEAAASGPMPQATCPPVSMPASVVPQPAYSPVTTIGVAPSVASTAAASSVDLKYPSSKTTSLKAELGSTVTMSEASKKLQHKSKEGGGKEREALLNAVGMVRKEPPWIEGVKLTPELVYQYQLGAKSLDEVLKADLEFLRQSKQPSLVNDQLEQLFLDLDIEGIGPKLIFEEAGTNNVSENSSDGSQRAQSKRAGVFLSDESQTGLSHMILISGEFARRESRNPPPRARTA